MCWNISLRTMSEPPWAWDSLVHEGNRAIALGGGCVPGTIPVLWFAIELLIHNLNAEHSLRIRIVAEPRDNRDHDHV
jgi:hypothetical protein